MLNIEEAITLINSLESEAGLYKKSRDEITANLRKVEAKSDELRQRIIDELKADGVVKDSLANYEIALRSTPATIEIPDVNCVPDEFIRIKREPDKIRIKDAAMKGLKANWFSVVDGKETLIIKGKI